MYRARRAGTSLIRERCGGGFGKGLAWKLLKAPVAALIKHKGRAEVISFEPEPGPAMYLLAKDFLMV